MTIPENINRTAKQERKLIAAEEKATRSALDAQAKHERARKKLAKSEKRAQTTAEALAEAEIRLAAARSARATGPDRHEEPPGD